jgi:hypothetical protein
MVVRVGNADTKNWWRNFRRPQNVTVRVRGRDIDAIAQLAPDDHDVRLRLMKAYRAKYSRTLADGRPAMWRKPWRPSEDELRATAADETFVVLRSEQPFQATAKESELRV